MNGRAWTDEEIALLGTDTDRAIAARLGRGTDSVRIKRSVMKIAPFNSRNNVTPELRKLFGKVPDSVIAKRAGVAPTQVGRLRNKENIPTAQKRNAAAINRWLDKVPAKILAKMAGISRQAVYCRANALGISHTKYSGSGWRKHAREWLIHIVGSLPDDALAELTELPVELVREVRESAGIPEGDDRFKRGAAYSYKERRSSSGRAAAHPNIVFIGRQNEKRLFRLPGGSVISFTPVQLSGGEFREIRQTV